MPIKCKTTLTKNCFTIKERTVYACPDPNYPELTELTEVRVYDKHGNLLAHDDVRYTAPNSSYVGNQRPDPSAGGNHFFSSYLVDGDNVPIAYTDYPEQYSVDGNCDLPDCKLEVGCAIEIDAAGDPVVPANTIPAFLKVCKELEVAAVDGSQCVEVCTQEFPLDALILSDQQLYGIGELPETTTIDTLFPGTDAEGLPALPGGNTLVARPTRIPTIFRPFPGQALNSIYSNQTAAVSEAVIHAPLCELQDQGRDFLTVRVAQHNHGTSRAYASIDGGAWTLVGDHYEPQSAPFFVINDLGTFDIPAGKCAKLRLYQFDFNHQTYGNNIVFWDLASAGTTTTYVPTDRIDSTDCGAIYTSTPYQDTAGDGAFRAADGSGPFSLADLQALGTVIPVDCATGSSLAFTKTLLDGEGGELDPATWQWASDCNLFDGEVDYGCLRDAVTGEVLRNYSVVNIFYVATGEVINSFYRDPLLNPVILTPDQTFGNCSVEPPTIDAGCLVNKTDCSLSRSVNRITPMIGGEPMYSQSIYKLQYLPAGSPEADYVVVPTADEEFSAGECQDCCEAC